MASDLVKKFSIMMALDGETAFKQAITNCNNKLKETKQEIKLLTLQYDGNQNTIEALTKKYDVYTKALEAEKKKQEAIQKAIAQANNDRKRINESIAETKKRYDEEKDKLTALEKEYGKSSQEYKEQKKLVEELHAALKAGESNYQAATNRESKWNAELMKSKISEQELTNKIRDYTQYMNEAKNSTDGCATSMDQYGHEIKEVDQNILSLLGQSLGVSDLFSAEFWANLAANGVSQAASAFKSAAEAVVGFGMDFEREMSKVEAISGASTTEMTALSDKAKELGASTVYSASQVAEAMSTMSLAGFTASDTIESISGVLDLAASSAMDIATAAEYVTDNLNAFGLSAKDANYLSDIMATAMSNASMTTTDLGEAYKQSAATATQFGIGVEDLTATLMVMANQGKQLIVNKMRSVQFAVHVELAM